MDYQDFLLNFVAPVLVFFGLLFYFHRIQAKTYKHNVERFMFISQESLELGRQNLRVLEEIKAILQDRKT